MLHHPDSFYTPNIIMPGLAAPKKVDEDVRRWLVDSYPGARVPKFTPKIGKPNKNSTQDWEDWMVRSQQNTAKALHNVNYNANVAPKEDRS